MENSGELTTVEGQCKEGRYQYAELTALGGLTKRLLPPLYEPILTGIVPLAMVLRGFERMKEPEVNYSVVQEWYCEAG